MQNLNDRKIHSEEVQDILLDTPRWLTKYSILSIVIFLAILFVICFSLEYSESGEISVIITETDSASRTRLTKNSRFNTAFVGKSYLSQAMYGKINDSTVVTFDFPFYPVKKFGSITGMILKSPFDRIDSMGRVETIVAIQLGETISPGNNIEFRKGMRGEGIVIYSREKMISKILE